MIKIGRPIENVTINGKEWLVDTQNELIVFKTTNKAINFLKSNGYKDYSSEELESIFLFEEV